MHGKVFKLFGKVFVAAALIGAALLPLASAQAESTCTNQSDPNCLYVWGSTTIYPITQISETRFFPGDSASYNIDGSHSSGYGQSYLLSGQVDIAASSGACSDGNAGKNGANAAKYTCSQTIDNVVGMDAVSVVINVNNPCHITSLTKAQVQGIYEHTITQWKQIDTSCASNDSINPYARAIGSGTRSSFIKLAGLCVDPSDYDASQGTTCISGGEYESLTIAATTVNREQASPDMKNAVAGDKDGIGYVGLDYLDTPAIKALPLDFGSGAVSPDKQNVLNSLTNTPPIYPMSRQLHLFTIDPSKVSGFTQKPKVADYIAWEQGQDGQSVMDDVGEVSIYPKYSDGDVNESGTCTIGDVVTIGNYWNQTNPVPGWIRADANYSGSVTIGDVTTVGNHWSVPASAPCS